MPTPVDPRPDTELLAAMRAGDERAFEAFYGRHRDWVVAVARRFAGSDEDALDVLQETFAYFLRKLPGLELRCSARTFFYPAVKHLALAPKASARRLELRGALPETPAPDSAPGDALAEEESLERRLRRLGESQAEVVRLRFAGGLDLAEIAEALAIPLGTVKSRLHAALEALRRDAGPPEPDGGRA